jgi:hypothetical protein
LLVSETTDPCGTDSTVLHCTALYLKFIPRQNAPPTPHPTLLILAIRRIHPTFGKRGSLRNPIRQEYYCKVLNRACPDRSSLDASITSSCLHPLCSSLTNHEDCDRQLWGSSIEYTLSTISSSAPAETNSLHQLWLCAALVPAKILREAGRAPYRHPQY